MLWTCGVDGVAEDGLMCMGELSVRRPSWELIQRAKVDSKSAERGERLSRCGDSSQELEPVGIGPQRYGCIPRKLRATSQEPGKPATDRCEHGDGTVGGV
jgi:hypothetical protein